MGECCRAVPQDTGLKLRVRLVDSYDRIQTLSGFANGVFLILISIFILFEGVQRM